jgi:hypothetical protein
VKLRACILFVLLLAGCGGESSAPAPEVPTAGISLGTTTGPKRALPPPVEETREQILAAAAAHDYEALGRLIPEEGFTFSYGASGRPIDYWKDLEAAGETPFETMAGLLALRHTRAGDMYAWPWAHDRDPAKLTNAQKKALAEAGAATRKQLDQMGELGHYLGWRLGIRRDGTWAFFVAGD